MYENYAWDNLVRLPLSDIGLSPFVKSKIQKFRGVGGETVSREVKVFPIGIGGKHGELHSAETPGDTPLLLSRPFMEALGTVIDLYNRTVSFRALEVQDLPLIKTAKGHLAIDLLNFNTENIGELRGFMNEFPQDLEKAEVDDSWASEPASSHEPTQQHQEPSSVPQSDRPPSQQSDETDYGAYDPTRYPYRLDYVDDPADDEARAHRDFIEMLRQDVEGYEREFGPLPERDALLAEGDHCDDALVFESFVQEGLFSVRKLTNRKGKKIDHMDQLLDSSELNKKIKLCGNNSTTPGSPLLVRYGSSRSLQDRWASLFWQL